MNSSARCVMQRVQLYAGFLGALASVMVAISMVIYGFGTSFGITLRTDGAYHLLFSSVWNVCMIALGAIIAITTKRTWHIRRSVPSAPAMRMLGLLLSSFLLIWGISAQFALTVDNW